MTTTDETYRAIERIAGRIAFRKGHAVRSLASVDRHGEEVSADEYAKRWSNVRKTTEFTKLAKSTLKQAAAVKAALGETAPSAYFDGLRELLESMHGSCNTKPNS